jgi:hypothetical protein
LKIWDIRNAICWIRRLINWCKPIFEGKLDSYSWRRDWRSLIEMFDLSEYFYCVHNFIMMLHSNTENVALSSLRSIAASYCRRLSKIGQLSMKIVENMHAKFLLCFMQFKGIKITWRGDMISENNFLECSEACSCNYSVFGVQT